MDTIFALATAPGKAGVAVIRVSGPGAFSACEKLSGWLPESRAFRLVTIRDEDGTVIDRGLALAFEHGHSFTGEEVVELQLHGSPAIAARVLTALGSLSGLRPAEAGEFTRRALENEKLDLTQVEGLADLIDAETELQRRQAMAVFDGVVSERLADWRRKLLRAMALLEASIDFADEDVPVDVLPEVRDLVTSVREEFEEELAGIEVAERLRDGFTVAIVGQPNAGKSTLLNRLAGRDVAITSDIAGTTRDILEVSMDLDGLPVTFLDTAGLRETTDSVESIGVSRAIERAGSADIRVFLRVDEDESWPVDVLDNDIVVAAKSDFAVKNGVSGLTGKGVPELLGAIKGVLMHRVARIESMTRQRHANSLIEARNYLDAAAVQLSSGELAFEFVAEELRSVLRVLEEILGYVGVEDVLGEIFSSFCIGK